MKVFLFLNKKCRFFTKVFLVFAASYLICMPLTSCIKRGKEGSGFVAKKEETFYSNLAVEPENLHPIKGSDYYSSLVQGYILESLLQRNQDTYEWEPSLAERWEQSSDGKTFVFHLHKGLKWSDGKPLTAKDVKFSLEAYKNPSYGGIHYVSYFEGMKSAEVIDDYTVKFNTKDVYFKNFETVAGMLIIPEHIYRMPEETGPSSETNKSSSKVGEEKLNLNKTVIGSGPYKIIKYQKGKMIVLSKNEDWFGKSISSNKGQWNFKNIVFRFISDSNDAIFRMQKEDLDFIALSAEDFEKRTSASQWGDRLEKVKYSNKAPSGYGYIGFNLKNPLFQDRRTRKALAHLLNRELMNEKFRFNYSKLATGPWYSWSEYADSSVKPILFDPKEAARLLQAAGWRDKNKDGILEKDFKEGKKDFSFSVLSTGDKDTERYLTVFQEDLKKAGIHLSIKVVDWTSLLALMDKKNFDSAMLGWGSSPINPSLEVDPKQIWHSDSSKTGGSNYISYSNSKVDKLIDKARRQLKKEERVKTLKEVYRLIASDVPYIFLFNNPYRFYGVNKRIQRPKPTFQYKVGMSFWSFVNANSH